MQEAVTYLPSQQETLGWCSWPDEILAVLMYGGVRGGKSFTACKLAQIIADKYPGSQTLICRNTKVNLRTTTEKLFFDVDSNGNTITSRELYDMSHYNSSQGILTWHNGSQTYFWGLDTAENVDRVKSTQWSFIILEEANGIRFDIIEFLLYTRLSHQTGPGKMLLLTNSDHGEDALFHLFFKQHRCKKEPCEMCSGPCLFRKVYCNTLDNEANLPEKYVAGIKRLMVTKPEFAKVYIKGEFQTLEGLIYGMYDERVHIIDFPEGYEWPETVLTVHGYDHGYNVSASCVETCKVLWDGTLVFWDEYYVLGKTVSQISKDLSDLGIRHIQCADPSIAANNQEEEDRLVSIQDQYGQRGIVMELADNAVDARIEKMRDLLTPDPDHICQIPGVTQEGMKNQPKFYLARVNGKIRCPMLHDQIKKRTNKRDAHGRVSEKRWTPESGNDHALDPCHIRGTIIRTEQGDRKIEDVAVGEMVVTPFGLSRVIWSGKTGNNRETMLAIFSDGSTLQTTPRHKVFVLGQGLAPLQDLMLGDILFSCKNLSKLSIKDCGTILMDGIMYRLEAARMGENVFMLSCGKRRMDLCQKVFMFTTRMVTALIGDWKTWKCLMERSMCLATQGHYGMTPNGPKADSSVSLPYAEKQKNGIDRKKEGRGIRSKLRQAIDRGSRENTSVQNAEVFSRPSTFQQLNSVLQSVDRISAEAQDKTMWKKLVRNVGNYFHGIDTSKDSIVSLVSLSKAQNADVYNIQTEHGLYYANGILVKNCEYIVNAHYSGRIGKKPDPEQGTAAWARQKAIKKWLGDKQNEMKAVSEVL